MAAGGTIGLTNLLKVRSNDLLVGNGVTGTGSLRVTIASDNSPISVNSAQPTTSGAVTAINSTGGQLTVGATILFVGQTVVIAGTNGGSGAITNGTYRISVTNGSTTFTLVNLDGTAITTTAGTPSGLTYSTFTPDVISNLSMMAGQTIAMGTGVRTAGTQRVTIATDDVVPISITASQTLGTVSTVTSLTQMNGQAIAMGTGVRSAGTQRVTIATDDVVPASQSGTWNINNLVQFNGTAITMKAASTAAAAADTSLVIALSPNSPLPAGTNGIGKLTANDGIDIGDVTINNAIGAGAYVRLTDGTNIMPTGDAAARGVFHRITDGTNTAAVIATINSLKTDLSSVAGIATVTGGVAGSQGVGGVAASGTATASAGNPLLTGAIATSAAPTYTTATSNPLSLTTGGSLRVDVISSLPAGTNTIGTVRLSAIQTNFGALGALNQVIGPWDVFNQKGTTVSIFSVSAPTGITVVAEVTIDGTNWVPNAYMKDATGVISSSITNAQLVVGAIRTIIVPQGTYQVRLRMSTWTSGTVNFIVMASHTDGETNLSISPNGTTSQPVSVQQIGGWDGTNLRAFSTDASGRVNIGTINSALPTGTNSIGNIGTVSTVTSLTQFNGNAIATNTGVRSAGTLRVTIATDDVVPASQSGTWNINNLVQLGGQAIAMGTGVRTAGTQRVTIATDDVVPASQSGTWNINALTSITNALPAGTNAIGKLAANDGVDIGDVTINNAIGSGAYVRLTDGTNTMPTGDAAARGVFHRVTDGTNTATVKAASTAAVSADTALVVSFAGANSATKIGDGTNNAAVKAASTAAGTADPSLVIAFSPNSSLPAGTNGIGRLTANSTGVLIGQVELAASQTLGTVSTVTSLSQFAGNAIATNTGVRSAGTLRVTIATDDVVPASQSGTWNINNLVQLGGQAIAMGTGVRSAGTQRVTIATDDVVQTKATPDATGTYAGTNATTNAYANNLVIKASAGTVYMLSGFNSLASPQFIQIHNATSLPADTSVPAVMFYVPALSNFSFDFGVYGRYFSTGIVVCNSTTGPTKTSGVANCWFDAQYK
jgi:hypothetical protein